jgi:hypothetical protein
MKPYHYGKETRLHAQCRLRVAWCAARPLKPMGVTWQRLLTDQGQRASAIGRLDLTKPCGEVLPREGTTDEFD